MRGTLRLRDSSLELVIGPQGEGQGWWEGSLGRGGKAPLLLCTCGVCGPGEWQGIEGEMLGSPEGDLGWEGF